MQTTLRHQISCTGIGLHSGDQVHMCLRPAEAGQGIVFKRIDVPRGSGKVPARFDSVTDTTLGTTIANNAGVEVATIEHLMAAFVGCGLDNVIVELDGPEVPIMDGSAAPFVFLIECAGIRLLNRPRRVLRILQDIKVGDGDAYASLSPADDFILDMEIDFESRAIARQRYVFTFAEPAFKIELGRARTFGFAKDFEALKAAGRARGGSLDNVIAIDGDTIVNDGGLRYTDECVRHKALDAVGDLGLAGSRILGRFEGYRSGHGLNNALLRKVFATPGAWRYENESSHIPVAVEDINSQIAIGQ